MASLVIIASLAAPVTGGALTCVGPTHTTPEAIVLNHLDIYDGYVPPADLFLVGTVVHRGGIEGDEPFPHRVLTVVVAGGYGNHLDSAILKLESTQWEDSGGPGGSVNESVYLPVRLGDDGTYRHGMCDIWGVVEDPYQLAAQLAPVAERAGLPYQLFPDSFLEDALSPTRTTSAPSTTGTTAATTGTTMVAPGGTIHEGMVELPARGWRVVALGLALLGGGGAWIWWLRRRSDIFERD